MDTRKQRPAERRPLPLQIQIFFEQTNIRTEMDMAGGSCRSQSSRNCSCPSTMFLSTRAHTNARLARRQQASWDDTETTKKKQKTQKKECMTSSSPQHGSMTMAQGQQDQCFKAILTRTTRLSEQARILPIACQLNNFLICKTQSQKRL